MNTTCDICGDDLDESVESGLCEGCEDLEECVSCGDMVYSEDLDGAGNCVCCGESGPDEFELDDEDGDE